MLPQYECSQVMPTDCSAKGWCVSCLTWGGCRPANQSSDIRCAMAGKEGLCVVCYLMGTSSLSQTKRLGSPGFAGKKTSVLVA